MTPSTETYSGLLRAYDHFNERLFGGSLPGMMITLQREKSTIGYYSPARFGTHSKERADEIAMNPVYFGLRPIVETLSTLVHEMIHQWQAHFGNPGRARYHNKEWGAKMEELGLMPSATAQPGGKRTGDRMSHYIIPGGLFERHCNDLLTSDFTLAWFDRFPPGDVATALGRPGGRGSDDDAEDGEDGDEEDDDDPDIQPVNRKSREKTKYTCPACREDGVKTNVWGRPGMKLVCGEHGEDGEAFEEQA